VRPAAERPRDIVGPAVTCSHELLFIDEDPPAHRVAEELLYPPAMED